MLRQRHCALMLEALSTEYRVLSCPSTLVFFIFNLTTLIIGPFSISRQDTRTQLQEEEVKKEKLADQKSAETKTAPGAAPGGTLT